jgi:hypothetical protein
MMDAPESTDFDYDRLQLLDDILHEILRLYEHDLCQTLQQAELNRIETKIAWTKQRISEAAEHLSSIRSLFEERRDSGIWRLRCRQSDECAALERELAEMPATFAHKSAELLRVRKREKMLRLTHRFREAKQMREERARLEAIELDAHRRRWQHHGDRRRAALARKHHQQMVCLTDNLARQWQALEPESQSEEQHYRIIIENQERRMADVKGSPNDFRFKTTRDILKAKRDLWPEVTARRSASQKRSAPSKPTGTRASAFT